MPHSGVAVSRPFTIGGQSLDRKMSLVLIIFEMSSRQLSFHDILGVGVVAGLKFWQTTLESKRVKVRKGRFQEEVS